MNTPSSDRLRSSNLDYHAARVLLLIAANNKARRAGLDGLTKLAKQDFLVRYPVFLEQLAKIITGQDLPEPLQPTEAERLAVESRMIRYKYGPWDDRYYPILGSLIGLGLVSASPGRGRLALTITSEGKTVADALSSQEAWARLALRCNYIAETFSMTGNRLKELIYQELPHVSTTRHRQLI